MLFCQDVALPVWNYRLGRERTSAPRFNCCETDAGNLKRAVCEATQSRALAIYSWNRRRGSKPGDWRDVSTGLWGSQRNKFGDLFREVADNVHASYRHASFDSSVIEVRFCHGVWPYKGTGFSWLFMYQTSVVSSQHDNKSVDNCSACRIGSVEH